MIRSPRPSGPGSARSPIALAPALSAIGLLVVGMVSLGLLTGNVPSPIGPGPGASGGTGPIRTATPSNVVLVDPRSQVPGTIVFEKARNLWTQSGDRAYQLTTGGMDTQPTFSADGRWVYFVRTTPGRSRFPARGTVSTFALETPALMRVQADGKGTPELLLDGAFHKGQYTWSFFIREPSVSPDGTRIALISDGPDPTKSDIVLELLDAATGTLASAGAPANDALGHQDPAWSPDGASIAFVKNGRDGTRGTPVIARYDVASGKTRTVTGPGYLSPSWSPDGRFLVATRTDAFGTDIVLLDAATGTELLRVTADGTSFKPVWSPAGDAIAFLHIASGVVDLRLVGLVGSAPDWSVGESLDLTIAAGLAAGSRPAWFIPADLLPEPTPSPTPVPTPVASPAPSVGSGG